VHTYERAIAALADPTRRELLERLRHGPRPVGELAEAMPVSRPAVSQHLKVLREARLVEGQRAGARHYYRVNSEGLDELRGYLDQLWGDVLGALKRAAEDDPRGGNR
jgi:DNA-binding transcriptional ArsR family regulator